jgi:hypothetical protein
MAIPKSMMPPDTICTRLDGWLGGPDEMPASVAELIVRAMPHLHDTIPEIRARMVARQWKVFGHD